jgi:hypothetical protein
LPGRRRDDRHTPGPANTARARASRLRKILAGGGNHGSVTCLTSVQWADPSSSTLIVARSAKSQTFSAVRFDVISHGRFTPLPTPPGVTVGSPPDIAW